MMCMTEQTFECRAGGLGACIGRTLRSNAGAGLYVSFPPRVGMGENRERRGTCFCIVALVSLRCEIPLTKPPPEASSSVARDYIKPEVRA